MNLSSSSFNVLAFSNRKKKKVSCAKESLLLPLFCLPLSF